MVPRSRSAVWNGGTLHNRFGDRYVWLKQFGNGTTRVRSTRSRSWTSPPESNVYGIDRYRQGRCALCGCPDANFCHRKVLAERLAKRWGAEVEHVARREGQTASGQSVAEVAVLSVAPPVFGHTDLPGQRAWLMATAALWSLHIYPYRRIHDRLRTVKSVRRPDIIALQGQFFAQHGLYALE